MAASLKVLVTGAFGNVGSHVMRHLVAQGHKVTALDVHSPHNDAREAELQKELSFGTSWTNLTDLNAVNALMADVKPDAIVHLAAIIAPIAYVIPEKAYAVNVTGVSNLIEAARELEVPPRFVFTSSYSVYGPRNPYRDLPPITADTPLNPRDNYGAHKVWGERAVRESGLPWVIVRLPEVWSTDADFGAAPEFRKFSFMLSPDRKVSAIDARDAALALANAASYDVENRAFVVCGGEGWTGVAGELTGRMFAARGLKELPVSAFRKSDPEVDDSWYYEGIVDASDSQAALDYQRHSIDQYLDTIRTRGVAALLMPLIGGFVTKKLLEASPYGVDDGVDSSEIWVRICEVFGADPSTRDLS